MVNIKLLHLIWFSLDPEPAISMEDLSSNTFIKEVIVVPS